MVGLIHVVGSVGVIRDICDGTDIITGVGIRFCFIAWNKILTQCRIIIYVDYIVSLLSIMIKDVSVDGIFDWIFVTLTTLSVRPLSQVLSLI